MMKLIPVLMLLLCWGLISCGDKPPGQPPGPGPALPPAPDLPRVKIPTLFGEQSFYYEIRDGWAIAEGDIVLGPEEQISAIAEDRTTEALNIIFASSTSLSSLWPDGIIPFQINDSIKGVNDPNPDGEVTTADIEAVIDVYERRTPIRFVPYTDQWNHVTFKSSGPFASSSPAGRQWYGAQAISLSPRTPTGVLAQRNVTHEIGHTIGFRHEHNRPDRDDNITVNWPCIDLIYIHQFWKNEGAATIGLYDARSVMHYGSQSFSQDGCFSMTDIAGNEIQISLGLTDGDVNSIWKLYGKFDTENTSGDHFGYSMVAGDFDDDGLTDLAVGAPYKSVDSINQSGVVFLFKGTDTVLVPWRMLQLQPFRPAEPNDRLGYALAVGDFNGDGVDDLAASVLGRDGSNGGIMVYFFERRTGKTVRQQFSNVGSGIVGLLPHESGILFGISLATGDIDNDNFDDLIVGASTAHLPNSELQGGAIETLRGGALGLTTGKPDWELGFDTTIEHRDEFGYRVETGDFNNDGFADIAVATANDRASSNGQRSGAVYLYKGSVQGPLPWQRLLQPSGSNIGGDRFGSSLASGDFNSDGVEDLAVGAMNKVVNGVPEAGTVYLFRGVANADMTAMGTLDQSGLDTLEIADSFGSSLLSADVDNDGDSDLLVGAIGESVANDGFRSGQVFLFKQVDNNLSSALAVRPATTTEMAAFGSSMAAGDFDNNGAMELIVGAPKARFSREASTQPGMAYRIQEFPSQGSVESNLTLHPQRRWRVSDR